MMDSIQTSARTKLRPLGELVNFLDHKRRPVTEADRKPGPYPYLGANGQQGMIDGYLFDEPLVLLAEDGGHFDAPERGIAYRVSGKVWVNNHAHVLQPKPIIDWAYLTRALENMDVRPYVSGSTRAKLTKGQAEKILVPVPPIEEQRRIAAILDQADALRARRRAALAQLDEMARAIFVEMFGDPQDNKLGFQTHKLSDLCTRITDGTHQSPKWATTGIPFLFVANIVSGEIDFLTDKKISEQTYRELTRQCPIEAGDVLYSTVGSYGIPALVREGRKFAFQRHIGHIKPNRSRIHPEFLLAMLRSPGVRAQAERAARGVAQKTINLGALKDFIVFCPPLSHQEALVCRTKVCRDLSAAHQKALVAADALFTSLQHRAFRGEL